MPGPIFLEGDRVTLRPIEADDIEFVQRCMNDPRIWRPALGSNPMNREESEEFFANVLSDPDGVKCLVCADEEPAGLVSLSESYYGPGETSRARSAELDYWIAPEHHGNGYGSAATERIIRYAFEDRNLRRIVSRPGSFNDASQALLESLGFEHEGTLREATWFRGEYHDTLVYGLLRDDWRDA